MPFLFFTFRPQITEQNLLNQFLTIFLPEVKHKSKKYSYSIEEPNTLNQHFHLIAEFSDSVKDLSKLRQIFNKKAYADFREAIKHKSTTDIAFDDKLVKDDPHDRLKVLGYVNKATDSFKKYEGFTNEEVLEAVEYYYTTKHLEKTKVKEDLKVLTTKNMSIHILDYCRKNNRDPRHQYQIKLAMNKEGYQFHGISSRIVNEAFKETDIFMNPDRYDENGKSNESTDVHMAQENERLQYELEKQRVMIQKLKTHFKINTIEQGNFNMEQIKIDGVLL
jgi:REP element-mobilizing transposase RayT